MYARDDSQGFYLSAVGSADTAHRGKAYREQDQGIGGSLAWGYAFRRPIRVEAEVGYHTFKNQLILYPFLVADRDRSMTDRGRSNHLSLMINLFYDIALGERWEMNLGAGAGAMRFSGDQYLGLLLFVPGNNLIHYDNIDRLAAQVMGGVTFHVTSRAALTASYRLADAAGATVVGRPVNTGTFSGVELGLRIKL